MKIRILSSCTGEKRYSPANKLTQVDFEQLHTTEFPIIEKRIEVYRTIAEELYIGQQHLRLMEGVRHFRKIFGDESVELWILSAGYGIIPGNKIIVPYECTFKGLQSANFRKWVYKLHIPNKAQEFFSKQSDVCFVLLGDLYLKALFLDAFTEFTSPTIFLASKLSQKRIKGIGRLNVLPLSNKEAKQFSCGLIGLKGELCKRFLWLLTKHGNSIIDSFFENNDIVLKLLKDCSLVQI